MGTKITVTKGEMAFSPVQYHSFRVGPFTIEMEVPAGTSIGDAIKTANDKLESMADVAFTKALESFREKYKQTKT